MQTKPRNFENKTLMFLFDKYQVAWYVTVLINQILSFSDSQDYKKKLCMQLEKSFDLFVSYLAEIILTFFSAV